MPARRLSMRKIKEILRLHAMGLGMRQIARSCSLSHSTVSDYLARAKAAGVSWPLPEGMTETRLEELLFPSSQAKVNQPAQPDWAMIHLEMRHKGMTLQQLWLEYKQNNPSGYQYSRFCDLYRDWRKTLDVALRQTYQAGEKMFVDYAGQTVPVFAQQTGESRPAYIFVAVLGASNYTYAEASFTQDMLAWICAHGRAFEFFQGVPRIVVPDNPKTAVVKPCRYEPDLNPTYHEMASYYGTVIVPARSRKPRDKAKVETAVQIVERWILAPLRNRCFFSLAELNQTIKEILKELNERPFQKLPGSRRMLYETLDKPALLPLPEQPYELAEWKKLQVNKDYHVEVEFNYYSVPYQLVGQIVDVRLTNRTVEILHKGQRVALHPRCSGQGVCCTVPEHRPVAHQKYLEWTPSRVVEWAESIGTATSELVQNILKNSPHPEVGLRSCLGLVSLERRYSAVRLEAAASRALAIGGLSYRSVRSILDNGLDRLPVEPEATVNLPIQHANVRGARYFVSEGGPLC